MALPKILLNGLAETFSSMNVENVQNLCDALKDNWDILSDKFVDVVNRDERYCPYALLAGVNKEEFKHKTVVDKTRAAWQFAQQHRGEDPISLEIFLQDRVRLRKKPLLTQPDVNDIIQLCERYLKHVAA